MVELFRRRLAWQRKLTAKIDSTAARTYILPGLSEMAMVRHSTLLDRGLVGLNIAYRMAGF